MKIFASNQFAPIKSLKKAAKTAAVTLPLMTGVTACSPWLFPPPPPPLPYHRPLPPARPHRYPHRHFGLYGATQAKDTIKYSDVFELNKTDMAYLDNTKIDK